MAIDIIPKAAFPLVPSLPGVPALLRSGAQIFDAITLGLFDASGALNDVIGADPVKWGVFDADGNPVTTWDSFVAARYNNSADISTYPVEAGTFAPYNKVNQPFNIQVVLSRGGTEAERGEFLVELEAARDSLNLYTVATPEFIFEDVNIVGLDYSRQQGDGANVIIATITGQQVRLTAAGEFSATQNPETRDIKNLGQIKTIDDPNIDITGFA